MANELNQFLDQLPGWLLDLRQQKTTGATISAKDY